MPNAAPLLPAAQRVVNFFGRYCCLTKDKWAGRPFLLTPWQKQDIIGPIFGPLRSDGSRVVRNVYMEIASKNGKSELLSGAGLYGLVADKTKAAEVYICGKARRQAEKMFEVAAAMVRNSPDLHHALRIISTTKTIQNRYEPLSIMRALSADAGVEDGANPHFVLFDELHRQRTRDLYDVMKRKMSTRANPLFWSITTAGVESESPLCWEMHQYADRVKRGVFKDPSFHPIIYAVPPEADWKEEKNWFLANPAMHGPGAFKNLAAVREDFNKALRIPSQEASFRRFELCQWVSSAERWLSIVDWDKKPLSTAFRESDLHFKDAWAGLDLSASRDLTAFVLVIPYKGCWWIIPRFFLPDHRLAERTKRDNVPYQQWADAGLVKLIAGKTVKLALVRKEINAMGRLYNIRQINYDPWGAVGLAGDLEDDGFEMIRFHQSPKTYNVPCKAVERDLDKLRHGGHPVLRWNLDCTQVKRNSYDQIMPVKPDRQKSTSRIDGIVAMLMGLDLIERREHDDLDGFLKEPVIIGGEG